MDVITLFTIIYYVVCIVPIIAFFLLAYNSNPSLNKAITQYLGVTFVLFVVVIVGFRPIGPNGFNDTEMYINWLERPNLKLLLAKDLLFGLYIYVCSFFLSSRVFFVLTVCISVGLLYWSSVRLAGRKWFLFFMCTAVSLYFWNQQVFTIRQGIAAMLFTSGVLNRNPVSKIILCISAVGFHFSFALPLLCYGIIYLLNDVRILTGMWLLSVVIAYFCNKNITSISGKLITDTRLDNYWLQNAIDIIDQNFRWDVILYSGILLAVGLWNQRYLKDRDYTRIVSLYIFINIFVIIMTPFTDGFIHRFAYLSWFLSPLVIFYPMFREKSFNIKKFALIIVFLYFSVSGYLGLKFVS